MKSTIQKRISYVLSLAVVIVVIMSGASLYFFSQMSEQIEQVIGKNIDLQVYQKQMTELINHASSSLLLLVSLVVVAGGILIYLAPKKVMKPVRVYVNGLRELRNLKFETKLPVFANNELGTLGHEINAFVDEIVEFDEKKIKKIQFEKRKTQVLADILSKGVAIIKVEGEVLYMNTQLAKFLKIKSEEYLEKDYHVTKLPNALIDLFDDVINKKEKFENKMVFIGEGEGMVEVLVDAGMVRDDTGSVSNIILTFEDITHEAKDSVFKRISFS